MLIYLGTFAASVGIAAYGEYLRTKKNNEKGFYLCLALAVLVMAVLAGLRDPSIGTDSVVYEEWVADAKLQDGLLACIRQRHKTEPLFMTLVYLAAHVFGDVHWLYFMVDLLACGLFMIGLVQYKEYVSVPYGWLAYLCLYYGDTYNAERQSVALGVAFLAFSFAWKKKYHWAVLLLAVSCLFHNATFISFGALLIYILLQHFDNWWVKGGLAAFSVYLAFFSKAVVRLALNVDFIDRLYGYYYDANAGGFTLNPIIVRLPFLILPIVLYRWYAKEEGEGSRRFTRSDADFWIVMILIEMATAQLRNINVPLYRICLYLRSSAISPLAVWSSAWRMSVCASC